MKFKTIKPYLILGIIFGVIGYVSYETMIMPNLVTRLNCEQLENNFHREQAVSEYNKRCI